MTKKEMIDVIEQSRVVINFSRSYFNSMLKSKVEGFYKMALDFQNK